MILHNIDNRSHQRPCLPRKGTSRLKYNAKIGITPVKTVHQTDKQFHVIIAPRHEMASAEIEPAKPWQPSPELFFYMNERPLQNIRTALAVTVTMEPLDTFRQRLWHLVSRDTEACARSTRII